MAGRFSDNRSACPSIRLGIVRHGVGFRGIFLLVFLILFGSSLILVAQPALPPDPAVLLGHAPWPGMTAWDVAWCRDLVFRARLIEIREVGNPVRLVKVVDVRGWRKPNGFYGIKLNGSPIDEGLVWLNYGGTMTNLRVLFTYGSDPVKDVTPFRD